MYKLYLSLILISFSLWANPEKSLYFFDQEKADYLRFQKRFTSLNCLPDSEKKYEELLKKYRGEGFYLPYFKDKVDVEIIKKYLPELKTKKEWIKQQIAIVNRRDWKKTKRRFLNFEKEIDELLKLKFQHFQELNELKKKNIEKKSEAKYFSLKKHFHVLLTDYPFLLSYKHPVDHLNNRLRYDEAKDNVNENNKKLSLDIYFLRKILEDGALDADHSKPDIFLRSTIDTISLEFQKDDQFLSENLRSDLIWTINRIDKELSKGKQKILERLIAWENRVDKQIQFYQTFFTDQELQKKMIREHIEASENLKKYVYDFQKNLYLFWRDQSDVQKTLFVVETILINEVGGVDGPNALDRYDVAKIILNRTKDSVYNTLPKDQELYQLLRNELSDHQIQKESWLNVLFKKGEFSFTYPYISGVIKMLCPDMSKKALRLLDKNLEIAYELIKLPQENFTPIRYFSRAAMIGRIDMAKIWKGYLPFPERAGRSYSSKIQKKLKEKFLKNQFQFLYSFLDPQNKSYWVIKIDKNIYTVGFENNNPYFYHYRNPHDFTYFSRI